MAEFSASPSSVLQAIDIATNILRRIECPEDLLSAAAVCRTWRAAALDPSQLRSWTLDDTPSSAATGTKISLASLLPKTPPPHQWINPAADSPFASFKTPRSILRLRQQWAGQNAADNLNVDVGLVVRNDGAAPSPRTPSPLQQTATHARSLKAIICHKMVMGRYLGDIDICSSRLNDECLQLIIKNCQRLHTLRLQHICNTKQIAAPDAFFFPNRIEAVPDRSTSHLLLDCGCGHLSEKGFLDISLHCPFLISVTLILQHIVSRRVLQDIFTELGKIIKLQTLSIDLRMPSFGQSLKSEIIWENHLHCTDKEILALLGAGGPPLNALALNRCDLSDVSIHALAKACPNIEAIDLHGNFQIRSVGLGGLLKVGTFLPPKTVRNCFLGLKDLTFLSAAALGVVNDLEVCEFGAWKLHSLKRLRLESKEPLGIKHLEGLRQSCPQLESLHLIWHGYSGLREAHIYPFTQEGIMDYARSVFI